MLSDPLKLIPLIVAIGVMGALMLGKVNAQEAVAILAGGEALHAGISALNNVNPPKP